MTSHPYVVFVPFTHMLKTYILYCFFHEAFSILLFNLSAIKSFQTGIFKVINLSAYFYRHM